MEEGRKERRKGGRQSTVIVNSSNLETLSSSKISPVKGEADMLTPT